MKIKPKIEGLVIELTFAEVKLIAANQRGSSLFQRLQESILRRTREIVENASED